MSKLFLMSLCVVCAGMFSMVSGQPKTEAERVYRHIVLFKFNDDATTEQIDEIVTAFGQLKNEVDTIISYEHGTDVSPEKLAKGFTHCFLVTFKSKADLEAYLPHPSHIAFTEKLKPILSDVLVVDYWTEN
ncbi:Dabb family protein [Rubinisphaera italica]|uniref:Stress responsive A/B Barrel Domain protein n=1 Tax=Rubinisphaera italica TaxID=2527969 RepID=A0A5C5XLN8_9PLAN|nr:Dabb family protein [Rubinisphaera italica]TWT64107.1 Stress responsive A/B Barrel Domain protein [Rubinisphaera italica]